MATIAMLEAAGALLPYDPDFDEGEFPTRWVHQAPNFPNWMDTILRSEAPDALRNLSPHEQVEQRLYDYCLGRPLAYDRDRKLLTPAGFSVWELKTTDVRLFGWLPLRRHFIAVCGEMKRNLRTKGSYRPFIDQVAAFRSGLDLDPPKSLNGVSPNDIC